ncbi:methyltransferase domain-containing protein [Streptomyces sp. A5-4]|uniref:methyltransferase domain-containing protein n=1 Tax=Streptomyces sp. A5-4 TaxID=3384771 RepID=UPI003DA7D6FC
MSAPTVPAGLTSTLPSRGLPVPGTAPHLPGLESVAPHDAGSGWLHDCLLGPHSADIVPYLSLARATGGPVLDLGSGSGRLSVPFARHGFAVEAVDRDQPSLTALRAWAGRIGPRVHGLIRTTRADLLRLRLRDEYQLALLAGAMVAAVPPHSRPAMLREIAAHLGAGGALALDYTAHEPAALAEHPQRSWAFQVPRFDGVEEWVIARQSFDLCAMSERITYHSSRTGKSSTHRVVLHTDKWIVDPAALASELGAAGLHISDRHQQRIDERTQSVLLICRA